MTTVVVRPYRGYSVKWEILDFSALSLKKNRNEIRCNDSGSLRRFTFSR